MGSPGFLKYPMRVGTAIAPSLRRWLGALFSRARSGYSAVGVVLRPKGAGPRGSALTQQAVSEVVVLQDMTLEHSAWFTTCGAASG
jgi:hypothetical protein